MLIKYFVHVSLIEGGAPKKDRYYFHEMLDFTAQTFKQNL
jgi:hypothetical protein